MRFQEDWRISASSPIAARTADRSSFITSVPARGLRTSCSRSPSPNSTAIRRTKA